MHHIDLFIFCVKKITNNITSTYTLLHGLTSKVHNFEPGGVRKKT